MKLHLCVDGGGTKTRAVISDEAGEILASGEAGPSNLTSGVQHTVAAIIASTRQAIEQLPTGSSTPSARLFWGHTANSRAEIRNEPLFAKVWVGVAGCARPPDYDLLSPYIANLFHGSEWKLSNDGELLTSPAAHSRYREVVTVICGTGSLALRWKRRDDMSWDQVERSGGWGALLGDEGSGWSMGREGVKSVLTFAANGKPLLAFHRQIMARLGVDDPHQILPALKLPDSEAATAAQAEVARKGRIAGCTKHVVPAALEGDEEALRILHKVAAEVVELLRPIVANLKVSDGNSGHTTNTMLVFGGGLSCVDFFRHAVVEKMAANGWTWGDVRVVADAAAEAVRTLTENASADG